MKAEMMNGNQEIKEISDAVIRLECEALERWRKGDPSGFLDISAPDVVYFDPKLERRIDGLEALTEYYEGPRGKIFFDRFELLNPAVKIIGDAAILTFNYVSYEPDGKKNPWNCTEVYNKISGKWLIVHTHWSYTKSVRAV
jgi:ketosteroid isomerase-like protein